LPESEKYLCEGLGPATEEAVRTMERRFNIA
jgi:hypothetical protein